MEDNNKKGSSVFKDGICQDDKVNGIHENKERTVTTLNGSQIRMSMDENVLVYVHKDMLQHNGCMQQKNYKES